MQRRIKLSRAIKEGTTVTLSPKMAPKISPKIAPTNIV